MTPPDLTKTLSGDALLDAVQHRMRPIFNRHLDKIHFIQQRFPDFVDRKLELAQKAMAGHHVLPGGGMKAHDLGSPPRWLDNPVKDPEFLCHLNRMTHWRTLALAYALSEEEQYAQALLNEMMDWINTCPRPALDDTEAFTKPGPWRILEVGLRMSETWPFIIDFLLYSNSMTPEILAAYLRSMQEHGEVLAEVSPRLRPAADNSHYMIEMLGLLATSCHVPELAAAATWQRQAQEEIERCSQVQITQEGGQIEGCPQHHNSYTYWSLLAVLIGRRHGVLFSDEYRDHINRMLTHSLHCMRPSGTAVPWGDSDADRINPAVTALYGYLVLHRDLPLRMIADFVGQPLMRFLTLRCLHHIDDIDAVLAIIQQGVQAHEHPPLIDWQCDLKQVSLRTGWRRQDLSVFFACRSPVYNGHAHIDPMSFDLTALGRPLVVDPGRPTSTDSEERRRFKSAAWHNTLTINERDHFPYTGSFSFGDQGKGRILRVEENPAFLAVEAEHHCYVPVIHRRLLAIIDQRMVLVFDQLEGLTKGDTVQINYHVASERLVPVKNGNGVISDDGQTRILIQANAGPACTTHPAQLSLMHDHRQASTRVVFTDRPATSTVQYATLLLPLPAQGDVPRVDHLHIEHHNNVPECGFEIDHVGYRFAWSPKQLELERL